MVETDQDYNITATGTMPSTMRFNLKAKQGGSKIRLKYENSGSYSLSIGGVK